MQVDARARDSRGRALDALLDGAHALGTRARPHVLLITDIGPDPDDAKALLIAAVLHMERHVTLCGVVANGGHQALQRARLARCVLDHLRLPEIPVGVGSNGKESAPMPHEYALPGYAEVDDARVMPGARLIADMLRSAPAKSLRVVLISSLRDFADVLAADASLVLRKVHTVAVQGGLEPDASRPSGFRADTSVNNGFDMDAAESVYAFCFAHGVPMTVTSRHAVPMLPMQLARSFAERTSCPVMSYLAAAQYFGLEGLWQKLCAGKLPERCSKQWYFATFCSMDADAFEEGAYDELGASADIGAHLNGFVKPYDVIALMTVLPVSKQLFPQSALFEHRGVQHLLLLEEKHAVRALPVVNLLRETYHEVVLVTTARRNAGMATPAGKINVRRFNLQAMLGSTAGGGLASRRQLLQQGKQKQQGKAPAKALRAERYALNKPACTSSTQISDGASPRKSASHALGPVSDDGDVGHAQEREYSAVISHDDIVELLSNVLALAGQRQRAITTATLAIGCTLVVACFTAFAASVLVTEWLTPVQVEIAHTSTGACALTGGAFVHLSLSPTPAHRARIRLVAIAFGAFVGTAWALDDEKARLLRTVMPGYAPEYAAIDPANTRFFVAYSVVHALVHNLTWGGSSFALIALAIASRFTRQVSTRLLLCALWAHLGGASLFLAISRSVSNTLNYSAGTWVYANAQDQAHALFVFNAVIGPLLLAQAVATQFAGFRHSLIRLISQTSSALGTEASVAPLLGFGSRRGERAPEDVCDEAERAFLPRALEPALLAEIEAAGLGVHLHTAPLPRRPFSRSKRVGRVANSSLTTMASGPASSHAGGADSCDLAQCAQRKSRAEEGPMQRTNAHACTAARSATQVRISPTEEDTAPQPPLWADAYIVHCAKDDAHLRAVALCRWARAFAEAHRRPPTVWLDVLCADLSFSPVEALAHVPVHQAKCEQLVLLAGPALLEHLEPVAHCFAWEAIGGRVRDAHVELVAADTSTRADIIAGIDTFHVMNTRAAAEEVHERLLAMVEIASASRVNVALRELLEAAQRAARAQSDGNTGAAPRKKRASRMRRVSANTSARARPRAAAHVLAWLRERGAGEQPSAERCA